MTKVITTRKQLKKTTDRDITIDGHFVFQGNTDRFDSITILNGTVTILHKGTHELHVIVKNSATLFVSTKSPTPVVYMKGYDKSIISANGNVDAMLYDHCSGNFKNESQVVSHDSAHVSLRGHAKVYAHDFSTVIADNFSRVVAYDYTKVYAHAVSKVYAQDYVRVHSYSLLTEVNAPTIITSRVHNLLYTPNLIDLRDPTQWCYYKGVYPDENGKVVLSKDDEGKLYPPHREGERVYLSMSDLHTSDRPYAMLKENMQ